MENSSDKESTQGRFVGVNLYILGFALIATLITGVAIGLLIDRSTQSVQVVVTATPNPNSRPVARANEQQSQTSAQSNSAATTTSSGDDTTAAGPPTPTIMDFVLSDARHFQGDPNAPVTLIELSDFKWPYCGRFAAESLTQLREHYVNKGKVRFVYKHFAILGPESTRAAEASECAAEQDKFWEYHDLVFADQLSSRSTLSADQLTSLAAEIGLDTTVFRRCLDSGRYSSQIRQESLSVQSMGVRGTPAFLLNGVFISGAQPFEVFQQVIEEQLGNARAPAPQPPATEQSVSQTPSTRETTSPDDEIEGVIFFTEQSRDHQDGEIEYEHDLPPGGAHSDVWQNCGIYNKPLAQEQVMHSLEHGAVWVAYRPDLPVEQVETLRNVIRGELQAGVEPLVLLSPQPDLAAPLVATAWQVQLQLDSPNDERLSLFLKKYQNGPYTPEPGAPCTGGVGQPIE